MATIFEKWLVKTDVEDNRMRFPNDAIKGHLPFPCDNSGQSGQLQVIDENGSEWTLTCSNQSGKIYFTDGWREFRIGRGIGVGHRIKLYKDDESFGSEAQYKIKVN